MRTLVVMIELPSEMTEESLDELVDDIINCHCSDRQYRSFDIGNVPLSGVSKVTLNVEFDTRQ